MFSARHFLSSILLLFLPVSGFSADPPLQNSLIPIKPRLSSPAMSLQDTDGKPFDLASLRGSVVLINFWATWCPPCRREFPSMERLRKKLDGKKFIILAVNEGESVEAIDQFNSTLDIWPQFPILLDLEGDAMAFWPVRGLPTTFIIDKRGRMAYRAIGGREFDHPEIVLLIDKLLKEK